MNKLSRKILLTLIKKYERSNSFLKEEKSKKIYLSLKDDVLEEMYSSSFDKDELYNESFKELKDGNFIYFENEDTSKFKVILNLKKLDEIYKLLERDNPKNTLKEEKIYLTNLKEKYKNNTVLQALLEKSIEEVDKLHLPKSIYKNHEMLEIILKAIDGIMSNEEEILLRNLSIKLFSDSKTLENNSDLIFQRLKRFSKFELDNFYEFCDYYNVIKNVGFVYIKGNIVLDLNGEVIDLNKVHSIFAVPSIFLNKKLIKNIGVTKIMSVENETTFNYFNDTEFLYVFSKGHPTKKVITFLKLLKEFSPNLSFYHCGDIDWGGFNIYFDIKEKTKIDIKLFDMNIETLENFKELAKPLSEIDKRNLTSLLEKEKVKENKEISGTVRYMLKNNLKLEQEAIN